jgi:hypothetical protein
MNAETVAGIVRTQGGNFRLLNRVLSQMKTDCKELMVLIEWTKLLSKQRAKAW